MQALKELFGAILDRAGPERARGLKLRLCWRSLAGPLLAARTRAEVEGQTVVLHAQDERWAGELHALAPQLKARLVAELGGIQRVEVRIDRTARAPYDAPRAAAVDPPLDPGLAAAAARIADPALRARLETVAARYLAAAAARRPLP